MGVGHMVRTRMGICVRLAAEEDFVGGVVA